MKCSPEFRKRVAEQAELARRKAGRGYTGQLFFTYGEVKWILADLQALYEHQLLGTERQGPAPEVITTDEATGESYVEHHQF